MFFNEKYQKPIENHCFLIQNSQNNGFHKVFVIFSCFFIDFSCFSCFSHGFFNFCTPKLKKQRNAIEIPCGQKGEGAASWIRVPFLRLELEVTKTNKSNKNQAKINKSQFWNQQKSTKHNKNNVF